MAFLRYYLLATILVVLICWFISFLVSCLIRKKRVQRITKNMHSVEDYPFLGVALRFLGKNNEEMMEIIEEVIYSRATPFMAWLGPKYFMVIDHPNDIQCVMNAKGCSEKSDIYRFFNAAASLLAAPVHLWKPQRKQLSNTFNNQICSSFLPIFNEKANIFVENITKYVGRGDFNILDGSTACALDILCETAFGSSINVQNGENLQFLKSLTDWLTVVVRRMVNVFLHPDIIYKQTQLYQMEMDALARSGVMQDKMVLKKKTELYEDNINNNNDTYWNDGNEKGQSKTPQIFLERLLKMQNEGMISDQEIRNHMLAIILAGQDTSSYTIAMTILLLAIHPKIETNVLDELDSVLGDLPLDYELTMDDINRLIYLEQVIKETLRIYPVVPLLLRHCTEDTELPNCTVPAGTEVVVSVLSAHRRKDVWGEDANEFNPDHFSKEESAKRNPYSFMAFSNGPRDCIGRRFAFISIKIVLAKVLRRLRFSTRMEMKSLKFALEVTNKPVNGIHVAVENRFAG